MCGICGIYRFDNEAVDRHLITGMMEQLQHRGPDDEGVFLGPGVGLGHRRLSILDLSPRGRQPFDSEDGRFCILHNGEVYNYLELREQLRSEFRFRTDTDTEVILCAYQKWGPDALDRFNGMFAFVIYDKLENRLFAARDRFGIKPFYYFASEEYFAFASEIPALLNVLPTRAAANNQAIFDYLAWNRSDHTEQTFFADVLRLPHGHLIHVNGNAFQVSRWYSLRERLGDPWDTADGFRDALESAVTLRLRSDVPVGISLSGGLDSSSILSLAARHQPFEARQTFSAVYGHGEEGDESEYISEYEAEVGNMYFARPTGRTLLDDATTFVRAQGEPVPNCGPYAQFKVMESAAGRAVVLLDGQGADEQLAGYHYLFGYLFRDALKAGRLVDFAKQVSAYISTHRSPFGIQSLGFLLMPSRVQNAFRAGRRGCMTRDFLDQHTARSRVSQLLYKSRTLNDALLDHFEHKLEHLLKWQDRNSMWFSLEARVPFLDHRLVERTLPLPTHQLLDEGQTKKILRRSMKQVLPEKIRLRSDKVGFDSPADQWFMSPEWNEALDESILAGPFAHRQIIDPARVAKTRARWRETGRCNAQEVWKWVNLELWFREFID